MSRKRSYLLVIAVLLAAGTAIFVWSWKFGFADEAHRKRQELDWNRESATFPPADKTVYRMGLFLDVPDRVLYGTSVVRTTNSLKEPLACLYFTVYPNAFATKSVTPAPSCAYRSGFDPGYIEITQVKAQGYHVPYEVRGTRLKLYLEKALPPGEVVEVEMSWRVKIPAAAYRFGSRDGVFMLSNFYPVLTVNKGGEWRFAGETPWGDPFCFACADYLVKLSVPSDYQVIASGWEEAREAGPDGRDTVFIRATKARDFVLVVSSQHRKLQTRALDIPVNVWVRQGREEAAKELLSKARRMLEFYACTFASYPFEELDVIEVPMCGFQGMEYSGVVFLQDRVLEPGFPQGKREFLLAHEIAHQWWFGLVGNDQSREPWLDEGLANWSANLYLRRVEGVPNRIALDGSKKQDLSRSLSQMGSQSDYLDSAYRGGEAFWTGLEDRIGLENTISVLRRYVADNRFEIASTSDVLRAVRRETDRDLEDYFRLWFKGWQEKGGFVVKGQEGGE